MQEVQNPPHFLFTTCPGVTNLIPLPLHELLAFSEQIYQPYSNDIRSHGNRNLFLTPKFEQQQGRGDSFHTYLSHLAARALKLLDKNLDFG